MREIKRAYSDSGVKVTEGLIKYLLGSSGNDYYKLIHYNNHTAKIIPYNLYGTLNIASQNDKPKILIPRIELPARIIELDFKKGRGADTTVILTMDSGWAISFRIHSAKSTVEPSLKFDVQLVGQPSSLFFVDVAW